MRPGDTRVDLASGLLVLDDGAAEVHVPRGELVDPRRWGVRPGDMDMTVQIQEAFDEAPDGSTLLFEPGTYPISDTLRLGRQLNVLASGATFHLGTATPTVTFSPAVPENYAFVTAESISRYLTISERQTPISAATLTDKAALIWGSYQGNRPQRRWIRGLAVTRTASAPTAAARSHAGIVMSGCFECELDGVEITNFREGLVLLGNAEGCVHNRMVRVVVVDCRYGVTLYSHASGWVNQNSFYDGRTYNTTSILNDPSYDRAQWEFVRLMWGTTGTLPNGIGFYGWSLEGTPGRKLRLEGEGCTFVGCRWEASNGTDDITEFRSMVRHTSIIGKIGILLKISLL